MWGGRKSTTGRKFTWKLLKWFLGRAQVPALWASRPGTRLCHKCLVEARPHILFTPPSAVGLCSFGRTILLCGPGLVTSLLGLCLPYWEKRWCNLDSPANSSPVLPDFLIITRSVLSFWVWPFYCLLPSKLPKPPTPCPHCTVTCVFSRVFLDNLHESLERKMKYSIVSYPTTNPHLASMTDSLYKINHGLKNKIIIVFRYGIEVWLMVAYSATEVYGDEGCISQGSPEKRN